MAKLAANATYGFALLDLSKTMNVNYDNEAKLNNLVRRNNYEYYLNAGPNSNPEALYEIYTKRMKTTVKLPRQFSIECLGMSKMVLLSYFYDFFDKYFCPTSILYLCCDTDSIGLATSENSLKKCVKKGMENEYQNKKHKWLAKSEDDKTGLLLKIERSGDLFCSLNAKSYILIDSKSNKTKSAHKSIPNTDANQSLINLFAYLDSLFHISSDDQRLAQLAGI